MVLLMMFLIVLMNLKHNNMKNLEYTPRRAFSKKLTLTHNKILQEAYNGDPSLLSLTKANGYFSDSVLKKLMELKDLNLIKGGWISKADGTLIVLTKRGAKVAKVMIEMQYMGCLVDLHVDRSLIKLQP